MVIPPRPSEHYHGVCDHRHEGSRTCVPVNSHPLPQMLQVPRADKLLGGLRPCSALAVGLAYAVVFSCREVVLLRAYALCLQWLSVLILLRVGFLWRPGRALSASLADIPPPAEGNAPAGLQGLQGFPRCLPGGCDPPNL